MEPCRIVGAIALPIAKKEDKIKKEKNYRKPLTTKIGVLLFRAYAEKSRKENK